MWTMTFRSKKIGVGDTVSLAGTKMKMTVEKISGEFAGCVWFDRDNEINHYPFQIGVLEQRVAYPKSKAGRKRDRRRM